MLFILEALQRFGRRRSSTPRGYYLLRYYKEAHRDRIEQAVKIAQIDEAILVKEAGPQVAGKVAVYCKCEVPEAEGLFFQHYAMAKQEEHARSASHTRLA